MERPNVQRLRFVDLPDVLTLSAYPQYNRDIMAAFIARLLEHAADATLDPKLTHWLQTYLTFDVLLIDGVPIAQEQSAWQSTPVNYAADLTLLGVSKPGVRWDTTVQNFEAVAHYMNRAGNFDFSYPVMLEPEQGDSPLSYSLNVHYADLGLGLDKMNSKRRNEIRRADELLGSRKVELVRELPADLKLNTYNYWHTKDPESDSDCYMYFLWLWVETLVQFNHAYIALTSDESGWLTAAGVTNIGPGLMFLTYAQHSDHRANYAGTFTLASAYRLISWGTTDTRKLFLTCPTYHADAQYEAYKKHLSTGEVKLPSLFALHKPNEKAHPPYFIPAKGWVTA
jgi:hypothetical protein